MRKSIISLTKYIFQIYDPQEVKVFDCNIQHSEFIPLVKDKKSFGLYYIVNKKQYTIK